MLVAILEIMEGGEKERERDRGCDQNVQRS